MKNINYYTSGEFAHMAQVSVRTIRFYHKQNILKPTYINESGARFYSDSDFVRLQQILLLKYLGFSLDDIRAMTINDTDYHFMLNSLNLQLKLVRDRIEQMQMMEKAIEDTAAAIKAEHDINWSQMLNLIHLTNIEKSLKSQYQNATNISARINLHSLYSQNKQGWFPWIFQQCNVEKGMYVLEIGCGNGALWAENIDAVPSDVTVVLSDISEGMLRDARRAIGQEDSRFIYKAFDCHHIPFPDHSIDLVIANHVLFYCKDIQQVLKEIRRVIKPNCRFVCSTYGSKHMKEISELVQNFDSRITLSADKLYENFGLNNGENILQTHFSNIEYHLYDDSLVVDSPEPLIEYILSCHGNQNKYILDRYRDFRAYVEEKTSKCFYITKEAGIFICNK